MIGGVTFLTIPSGAGGILQHHDVPVGQPSNVGLGRNPIVTLAEARTKALENARAVDQGRDPRDRSRIPTFEQAAEKVIRLYEPTWRAGGADSSTKVWRSSLEAVRVPQARPQAGNRNHRLPTCSL